MAFKMGITRIIEEIASLLTENVDGVMIRIEPPEMGTSTYPEVGITLRRMTNDERVLGSLEPYASVLEYYIVCFEYSPDGVLDACNKRDALMERVYAALGTDRTLGGLVGVTQLGDVEFDSAMSEAGYFSGASITLKVYVQS